VVQKNHAGGAFHDYLVAASVPSALSWRLLQDVSAGICLTSTGIDPDLQQRIKSKHSICRMFGALKIGFAG